MQKRRAEMGRSELAHVSSWREASFRCAAPIRPELGVKPTCREHRSWDEELLGLELGELEVLGFDLDLIGFSEAERGALACRATERP